MGTMRFRVLRQWVGFRASALNNLDQVVLQKDPERLPRDDDLDGPYQPRWTSAASYLWDGRNMLELPLGFSGRDMNERMEIVGSVTTQGASFFTRQDAFYKDGTVTLMGLDVWAESINNEGFIAGSMPVGDKRFPCCWRYDELVWRGEFPGVASDINEKGDFIGVFHDLKRQRAFVYESGHIRLLSGPNGEIEGVSPLAINDEGLITGELEGVFHDQGQAEMWGLALDCTGLLWEGESVRTIPNPQGSKGISPGRLGPRGLIAGHSSRLGRKSAFDEDSLPIAFVCLDDVSAPLLELAPIPTEAVADINVSVLGINTQSHMLVCTASPRVAYILEPGEL